MPTPKPLGIAASAPQPEIPVVTRKPRRFIRLVSNLCASAPSNGVKECNRTRPTRYSRRMNKALRFWKATPNASRRSSRGNIGSATGGEDGPPPAAATAAARDKDREGGPCARLCAGAFDGLREQTLWRDECRDGSRRRGATRGPTRAALAENRCNHLAGLEQ